MDKKDKNSLNLIKSLKILALKSILKPDEEYLLNVVYRWFSEKFHTPLLEVENLPTIYVLKHFFEDYYRNKFSEDFEDLEPEKKQERIVEIEELLESDEETEERKLQKAIKQGLEEKDKDEGEAIAIKYREKEEEQTKKEEKPVPIPQLKPEDLKDIDFKFIEELLPGFEDFDILGDPKELPKKPKKQS